MRFPFHHNSAHLKTHSVVLIVCLFQDYIGKVVMCEIIDAESLYGFEVKVYKAANVNIPALS